MHNDRSPKYYALALAEYLGYKDDMEDKDKVLKFLQAQNSYDILKGSLMFKDWDYPNPLPWVPIQDSFCKNPYNPFTFQEAVKRGKFNNKVNVTLTQVQQHVQLYNFVKFLS